MPTTFRNAWPDELERAVRVCPNHDGAGQCFLAVEAEPVERIVGAAFWRILPPTLQIAAEEASAVGADFHWRVLPRYAGTETERVFLQKLKHELMTRGCSGMLKTRALFRNDSAALRALLGAGFLEHSTNVVFEGSLATARKLQDRMRRTFGLADRSSLAVTTPDTTHGEALKALIGQKEGLLSLAEIDRALGNPVSENRAFDPAWSTVLLDAPSARLIGAQLIRVQGEVMRVVALAIDSSFHLLPGLGWFVIMERWLELCEIRQWNEKFFCRVNPSANPIMHKLTTLFGYREIERLHTYAVELSPGDS